MEYDDIYEEIVDENGNLMVENLIYHLLAKEKDIEELRREVERMRRESELQNGR